MSATLRALRVYHRGGGSLEMSSGSWIGPYGVHVSGEIKHVVAADGFNIHYQDGSITELARRDGWKMSQQEYFARHTVVIDGVRWYQEPAKPAKDAWMDTD